MFGKQFRESLRRLDIRCAQRALWLGVHKEKEHRWQYEEELRRMRQKRDGLNRW